MSVRAETAGSDEANREALVRVLAGETRNALARVELAASELAEFETPPSHRERIDTIRLAVEEIDSLLGKIDLIAELPAGRSADRTDLGDAVRQVCARMRSSIQARGIDLDWEEVEDGLLVVVSRPALEGCVLSFLRVSLAWGDGPVEQASVRVGRRDDRAEFLVRASAQGAPLRPITLEREAKLELEVALAEWGGRLLERDLDTGFGFGFDLPLGTPTEDLRHTQPEPGDSQDG